MTVNTTVTKVTAVGNGAALVFSFAPVVLTAATDLQVTKKAANGVLTTLVLGTDYSITATATGGLYPSTGSITYPLSGAAAKLQTGELITMARIVPLTQLVSLENQGGYFPDVQEAALDKLTMEVQQMQELLGRALVFPITDPSISVALPSASVRANGLLGFDATGVPSTYQGLPAGSVSGAMAPVIAAATIAQAVALLGIIPVNVPTTSHFYTTDGAMISRLGDRAYVGAVSCAQAGNNVQGTWLGLTAGGVNKYMDTEAQFQSISTIGGLGAVFAARTQDIHNGTDGSFALVTHAQNDAPSGAMNAWGIYSSAVRATAAGIYTAGVEIDVTTLLPAIVPSAYNAFPTGVTTCLGLAAGGETSLAASGLAVNPTSAAILIFTAGTGGNQANPIAGTGAIFEKGIVFQNNALVGTDGSSGTFGIAMEMVKGQAIVWATNTGATSIGGMIRSDVVSGQEGFQTRAVFKPGGFNILGVQPNLVTEQPLFQVTPHTILGATTIANNLFVAPGAAGEGAVLGATGTDGVVDVRIVPKGAGYIWMGQGATSASTAGNFSATKRIAVKDGAGTVHYIPASTTPW